MRLAIMQPYFFPYLGHFSLIAACDRWVVFDISQYTPRTWMNRNRVWHPAQGWCWATVPLSNASMHMRTADALILDPRAARRRVLGLLSCSRHAPYHREVAEMAADVFVDEDPSLVRLNVRGLAAVCRHIGLPFDYSICSELALDLPANPGPGGWAPALCARLGASAYVNPVGGRALFDPRGFAERGLDLRFVAAPPFTYRAGRRMAEPNLSVLDVLLWNSPEAVLAAVHEYDLVRAEEACNSALA